MRIIAGKARGRRILSVPKSLPVRPISARIRQSLFDILRPRIMGCRMLDLFAGTGAVGLEALSRGAERVVFVDKDPRCVKVIEKNLARGDWTAKGTALRGSVGGPLGWVTYRSGVERFDIIFLGPPYVDEEKRSLRLTQGALDSLAAAGILEEGGWIVSQHHKKEPVAAPAGLELFRSSKYGDTVLSFLRLAGRPRGAFEGGPS